MAMKSAGGRFVQRVTGEFERLTGSWAAYINRPIDPRISTVELICCLAMAAWLVWMASQVADPPAADRYRLIGGLKPAVGTAVSLGAALAVYLALMFLVKLPPGARWAGAMLATAVAGAVAQNFTFAGLSPTAVAAGLVLAPGLVIHARCRKPLPQALAISGGAIAILAILRYLLRG